MGDATPFRNEAFEPDVLQAMSAAYEKACVTIQAGPYAELAREIVAKHVIELARQGCTDADKLCTEVLKVFGFEGIHNGASAPLATKAH
jgi:hypothetical protein